MDDLEKPEEPADDGSQMSSADPVHTDNLSIPQNQSVLVCPNCMSLVIKWKRNKILFWICAATGFFLIVPWFIIPLLPKYPYCRRCHIRAGWYIR